MLKRFGVFLMLGFLLHSVSIAQTPQPTPASTGEKHKPIIMLMDGWTGLHYYHDGVMLLNDDDLKKVVNSLNDYKANELWTRSKDEEDGALAFSIGSLGLMAGGAVIIGVDPNTKNNPNSIDGQQTVGLVIGLAGFVGEFVGLFKLNDAMVDKFNSVQRYNIVVYKECETSWLRPSKSEIQADFLAFKF